MYNKLDYPNITLNKNNQPTTVIKQRLTDKTQFKKKTRQFSKHIHNCRQTSWVIYDCIIAQTSDKVTMMTILSKH